MPHYTIRPVAGETDNEFGVELLTACYREKLGVTFELEQARDWLQSRDNPLARSHIAEIAGQPVSIMTFTQIPSDDEQRRFVISILIMPDYHTPALLHDLFGELIARVGDYQPDELKAVPWDFMTDYIDLLEAQGFEQTQRDQSSYLLLDEFDFDAFADVMARVEESGIRLVTLPDYEQENPNYQTAVLELNNAIYKDVPGFETNVLTLDQFAERTLHNPMTLREAWILALDGDQLVGMSYANRLGSEEDCLTELTGVIRSHRRRGITTAMKVMSFEQLREMGFKRIITGNEENNPMYQINVRLGFRPGLGLFHYAKRMTASIQS